MLKNLMEEGKRIDYNAPLLSVRRFYSSLSSESRTGGKCKDNPSTSSVVDAVGDERSRSVSDAGVDARRVDIYESEIKPGPVRSPGVVPFQWEEAPGCPKEAAAFPDPMQESLSRPAGVPQPCGGSEPPASRQEAWKREEEQRPGGHPGEQKEAASDDGSPAVSAAGEDGDDAFSDALETLSRADSCFMNCSVSGMTGVSVAAGGCFPREDLQAKYPMMDRFLPAAQAVATGSTQTSAKKAAAPAVETTAEHRRRDPVRLHQNKPRAIPQYLQPQADEESEDDSEDGDDCSVAGQFPAKGCGFLPWFCLKGSFANPVPGGVVGSGGHLPPAWKRSPAVKPSSRFVPPVKPEKEQTWEAVHRQKIGGGSPMRLGNGNKLTPESNHLMSPSDSQSPGSSSNRRSVGGGSSSPLSRNEALLSPYKEGKCLLAFQKEDGIALKADSVDSGSRGSRKSFMMQPNLVYNGGSGFESPGSGRTASNSNSGILGSPEWRLRHAEAKQPSDIGDEHFEGAIVNERIGGTMMGEACKVNLIQTVPSVNGGNDVSSPDCKYEAHLDALAGVELDTREKDNYDAYLLPLLPPPLPKSPSESWLSRTLPSVSSKNQAQPPSFRGQKFSSKKKTDQFSSASSK